MNQWFWPVFEVAINAIEMFVAIYFATALFAKADGPQGLSLSSTLYVFFGTVWLSLYLFIDIPFFPDILPGIIVFLCYAVLRMKAPWYAALIWSLVNMIILGILTFLVPSALGLLLGYPFVDFFHQANVRILSLSLSHILYTAIILLFLRWKEQTRLYAFMRKERVLLAMAPIYSVLLIYLLLSYAMQSPIQSQTTQILVAIAGVGLLMLNVGSLYVFSQMSRQAEEMLMTQARLQSMQHQVDHQKELQDLYAQMRKFRHEQNNHNHTMLGLVQMQEYESLSRYLSEIVAEYHEMTDFIRTGNTVVDAFLNSNGQKLIDQCIALDLDAKIPEELPLKDEHVIVLLGNLFNNAMEACQRLPEGERSITMRINVHKKTLYIYVENPTDTREIKKGNKWLTMKKNPGAHGFGIDNVDHIVSLYGGYSRRTHQGGVFSTSITIPLTK